MDIHGNMNFIRRVGIAQIVLLNGTFEKLGRLEIFDVLPEKLPLPDDGAVFQNKQLQGQSGAFPVEGKDIHRPETGYRHFLPRGKTPDQVDPVTEKRRRFITLFRRGGEHLLGETLDQFFVFSFQEQKDILHGPGVFVLVAKTLHTGSEASFDVVFQAWPIQGSVDLDRTGPQLKMAIDHLDRGSSQRGGQIGAKIAGFIPPHSSSQKDPRVFFTGGDLQVKEGLVVLQTDIQQGLVLFDQRTFQYKRFDFGIGEDDVQVTGISRQVCRFEVGGAPFLKIGANPMAKVFPLADVDDLAAGVMKKVDPGRCREIFQFAPDEISDFRQNEPAEKLLPDCRRAGRSARQSQAGVDKSVRIRLLRVPADTQ